MARARAQGAFRRAQRTHHACPARAAAPGRGGPGAGGGSRRAPGRGSFPRRLLGSKTYMMQFRVSAHTMDTAGRLYLTLPTPRRVTPRAHTSREASRTDGRDDTCSSSPLISRHCTPAPRPGRRAACLGAPATAHSQPSRRRQFSSSERRDGLDDFDHQSGEKDLMISTTNSLLTALLMFTLGGAHQPPAFICSHAASMRVSSSS